MSARTSSALAVVVLLLVAVLTELAGGVAGLARPARGAAALALAALPALVAASAVLGRRPHAVERATWWRLMRLAYVLLSISVLLRVAGSDELQVGAHCLDLFASFVALVASVWWEFAHSNADHAGLLPDRALDTVLTATALLVAFWVIVVRPGQTGGLSFFDWSNIVQTSLGLICVAVTGVSLAATRQRSSVLAWGFLSITFATFGSAFDVGFGVGARTTLAAIATGACTGLLTATFAVAMRRHGPPIVLDEGTARWRPLLTVTACTTPALLYGWEATRAHRGAAAGVPDATVLASALLLACVVCVLRVDRAVRRMDQLNASMDRIARSDHLTGMPNRRTADEELRRASAPGARLAVALCDLDHFKRVNDELGHTAGDNLLVAVAASWSRCLSDDEILARYGGEEFLLISPDGTAERLSATIEDMRAVTPDGQGFSAGVAEWDGRENVRDLVQRADSALYDAKAAGRGRTCIAPQPAAEEVFDGR